MTERSTEQSRTLTEHKIITEGLVADEMRSWFDGAINTARYGDCWKARRRVGAANYTSEGTTELEAIANLQAFQATPDQLAFQRRAKAVLDEVFVTICEKNRAYGDVALQPLRVFSKLDAEAGLRVRLDDKLARLARGDEAAFGENPVDDLMGYLILLKMAQTRE